MSQCLKREKVKKMKKRKNEKKMKNNKKERKMKKKNEKRKNVSIKMWKHFLQHINVIFLQVCNGLSAFKNKESVLQL